MKNLKLKTLFCSFAVLTALTSVLAYDITTQKCTYEVTVAHLDTHWQWTRNTTYNSLIPKTLHDNFTLFASYPKYVFSFAGAFRYWIVEQANTTQFGNFAAGDWDKLKGFITAGRWAVAGSCIDEIDPNMPCLESACRNHLYGNGYTEDRFGKRSLDVYLPDCFGFSYAMPTIANHFGIRGFSSQKFDGWGGWWPVPNNMTVFKWIGPDGNYIFAANKASGYGSNYEVSTAQGNAMQTQCGLWITYDYYGTGDQGGAPSTSQVGAIANLAGGMANGAYCFFAASDSLFRDLVRLEQTPGNTNITRMASYNGECTMETHGTGCYTHHADVHIRFRNMELGGLSAEPAAVIANKVVGLTYPQAKIWRAWFKGIDHAFHDDMTGTSIPDAYYNSWDGTINDLDSQIVSFSQVRTASNNAVAPILDTRVSSVAGAVPIVVYNPLGLDRRDVVQAVVTFASAATYIKVLGPDGVEVPSQVISGGGTTTPTVLFVAQAPAAGYSVYEVQPSTTASAITNTQTGLSITANGSSMSNNDYTVLIDATGDISQITAKKQGNKELFQKPSRWELRPDVLSTGFPQWEIIRSEVLQVTPTSVVNGTPIRTVVENGPVRVSVRVTRTNGNTTYTHYYRLCADSSGSLVTVDNSFNWNSRGNLLKAAFYLNVSADSAIYGVGIGTIKRPVSGTDKRYENPHQQWQTITDGTSGVAIIDHYKYGSSSLAKNNLMLTLVHSPSSTNFTCEGENRYPHSFSYAIYGYAGNWNTNGQVEQQTQRFQLPLSAFQATAHAPTAPFSKAFSFVRVSDPRKIMITAVKKAGKTDKPEANNDYVVRVREISGAAAPSTVSLIFTYNVTSALSTNGMEDIPGAVTITPSGTAGNEVAFSIGKYQLKTFRIALGTTYVPSMLGVRNNGRGGSIPSFDDVAFKVALSGGGKLSVAKFLVTGAERVQKVFLTNVKGQIVRILSDGTAPLAASSRLVWDGCDASGRSAPAGAYVVTVVTDKAEKHAPLQLIR